MTDENIKKEAEDFAKANKKRIAKDLTNISKYPKELNPISVFMAGSPGAGKTEASLQLIKELTGDINSTLRIDTDEYRNHFKDLGYNGSNSSLFQTAATFIAEKVHDFAIVNEQSFVFDGTFSKVEIARKNVVRSLNKKRFVQILCVYQDPLQAWEFVKARELKDGRNVPKQSFIEQYFNSRTTVNTIKREFPSIQVDLLIKNIDGSTEEYKENIDNIDNYIKEKYTEDILKNILN